MATYSSHRLIMEKSENFQFLLSCCRYLNFVFAEMFIEKSSTFHVICVLILPFDWLQDSKIFFSETVKRMKPVLCIHVPDSSLYIICFFIPDR